MGINTVSMYIKGNKGYYGLHIENGTEIISHLCDEAVDSKGKVIGQNCSEVKAACNGLQKIKDRPDLKNCKIDIFSNLDLHDKFKSQKAMPDILKPYIDEFNQIVTEMTNLNPLEPPEFHWRKKTDRCPEIDRLVLELKEFKKTHPH